MACSMIFPRHNAANDWQRQVEARESIREIHPIVRHNQALRRVLLKGDWRILPSFLVIEMDPLLNNRSTRGGQPHSFFVVVGPYVPYVLVAP